MSDAVTVPRGAVSQIKARLMSYLFGACQPDHGSVFGWFDDHADEALEFALRDALAASTPVGGWAEPVAQPSVADIVAVFRANLFACHEHDDRTLPIEIVNWGDAERELLALYAAPPPPSVSIDKGSRLQEAVPGEGLSPLVVALCESLRDNDDPNEPIADNGASVIDGWRDLARRILTATPQPADGCSSNEGAG